MTGWWKLVDYDDIAGRFELKGKQLPTYILSLTAESMSLDYFLWVTMLDSYFERQDLDPYEKMSMARTALIGDVQHWWSNLEYHFMYTWEQMKKKLQRRFVPPPPTVTSEVQPKVSSLEFVTQPLHRLVLTLHLVRRMYSLTYPDTLR